MCIFSGPCTKCPFTKPSPKPQPYTLPCLPAPCRLGASGGSGGVEIPTDLQVGWVEPDGSETVYGRFTVARLRAEL